MTPAATESKGNKVEPLQESLKPLSLPPVVVQVVLGGKVRRYADQVAITFEGESVVMHQDDFAIVARAADRVAPKLPRKITPGMVIKAVEFAHTEVAAEVFRPGLIRVIYYTSLSKASAFYRCLMPAHQLNSVGKVVATASAGRFGREALEYDVVVIQIGSDTSSLEFMKALQKRGKKVIYEIDDAFDCLEPWHPQYATYSQPERVEAVLSMIRQADAVQVSTQWLADRYAKHAKMIGVVRNTLELSAWPRADRLRKDGLFKVAWAGSESHSGDLALVLPALTTFAKRHQDVRVQFLGQGGKGTGIPDGQVEVLGYVEFEDYSHKLASLDADVALAPLCDVPFNRGKSNLRVLQYWATGYPVLASPVTPYQDSISDDQNGFICRTEADWLEKLELLHSNRAVGARLTTAGFASVKAYDALKNAQDVYRFYKTVSEEGSRA